jgi:hypothetical protein
MTFFLLLHSIFSALLLTSTQYQSLCLPRSSHASFSPLIFACFHNQGPTGPQHSLVTRPKALQVSTFYFISTSDCARKPVLSALSLSSMCRPSFLCLVPSFNCTWYLDPFPHAFTESCEATGFHNTISTGFHSPNLPSILQSKSYCVAPPSVT